MLTCSSEGETNLKDLLIPGGETFLIILEYAGLALNLVVEIIVDCGDKLSEGFGDLEILRAKVLTGDVTMLITVRGETVLLLSSIINELLFLSSLL